ncbi:MAG: hypothetical protein KIS66_01110 [Fimbriimonadaceae bacterium]|nr:hypothetical protein [Fimbriimonadaceae bacterium]
MAIPRPLPHLVWAILVLAPSLAPAATEFVLRHKNSEYTVQYEPSQRRLAVFSNNANAVWNRDVSRKVPSLRAVAGVATAAGPVLVYDDGVNTYFSLVHWKNGGNKVDQSGEPLDGNIGPGVLLNCMFQPGPYGAKVIARTLSGGNVIEHKWDINLAGNHAMKSRQTVGKHLAGKASLSTKLVSAPLRFSVDVPRGFREVPVDQDSIALYGPVPDLFVTLVSQAADHSAKELGDAYMKELGLKVQSLSNETLDDGTPALLYIGQGAVNGVPSKHAALVFASQNKKRVYVVSLTTATAYEGTFMFALEEVLRSLKPTG